MSRSKARGTAFESEVVNYLRAAGLPNVERRALAGGKDRGDLSGIPGWAVEIKSLAKWSPATVLTEAKVEAVNAGAAFYCAIVKRRRSPGSSGAVADAYVLMPLDVWAKWVAS